MRKNLSAAQNLYIRLKGKNMNASGTLRKLKDLDALEKRIKQTVTPSPKMLQMIETERQSLLKGEGENETLPRK